MGAIARISIPTPAAKERLANTIRIVRAKHVALRARVHDCLLRSGAVILRIAKHVRWQAVQLCHSASSASRPVLPIALINAVHV